MQSETGFPSSRQLKSYVASMSRLKLAARAVLSADAGLLVISWFCSLQSPATICEFACKIWLPTQCPRYGTQKNPTEHFV